MAQEQRIARADAPSTAILGPSLKVGAACACAGFLFGGTTGVLKSTTPLLFATASSIQTFALGTTFWALRANILQTGLTPQQTPSDFIKASTLAGGVSGGLIAAVTRGRRNVLPATLMWSLFGCLGQVAYNKFGSQSLEPRAVDEGGFWERMAKKRWSPMKFLTNEEYAEMLREKMLRVEAEIAVLDDKIATLRQQSEIGATTEASLSRSG